MIRGLPLFGVFFLWGFGSGGIQLARPLFAFEVSDSAFLVAVMVSVTATSRIVFSPLSGYLSDRFGRKPLVMFGAALRGAGSLGQFFVDSYTAFVILEFFAQAGVSVFQTSVTVLVSDVTSRESRGRFLAVRTLSTRFGHIAGPATGGLIAALFQLRHVFFFDAVTKFTIVAIVFILVRETNPMPRGTRKREEGEPAGSRINLKPFANPTFIALGAAAVATTLLQQGIAYSVLPVHAVALVGVSPATLGAMTSVGAFLAMVAAYPNGILSDRAGRKYSLAPGLLVLTAGMALLGLSSTYAALFIAIGAFGVGEGHDDGHDAGVRHGPGPGRRAGHVPRHLVARAQRGGGRSAAGGRRVVRGIRPSVGVHDQRGVDGDERYPGHHHCQGSRGPPTARRAWSRARES